MAEPGTPSEPSAASQAWKLTALLDRQSVDWQRGDRTPAERYAASAGALREDAETILNLVYHEVLLRRRLDGESPSLGEYAARFPELADQLAIQFAIDEALPADQAATEPADPPEYLGAVQIPGYEVHEVLGRGGMGVVYRARQRSLNRTVALKMILGGAHAGPRQATRFRTEAELIARLQHPNIVQIHEIGEHEGRPFLALEFVDGGTLDGLLDGTPLPSRPAAELVERLARAVAHAHERGVVHRDLKPANVLMTRDREPRIADFGLAKLLAADSRQTDSGALVGTPSYMAPEQVDGTAVAIGPATDIYALGAILYEALTGRPPFRGESPVATMLQVRGAEIVPPRRLRPELARDLETITLRCLARDPRHRYAAALDLADDLRRHLDGRPILARPVPHWERLWLWARRQRALAAGVLLGLVATLALIAGGIAYSVQLRRLNGELSATNRDLAAARSDAERNARDALGAITQMLVQVADQRLSGVPEAEPIRRELLKEALAKLELLQARNPADPEIRHEMAKAHLAVSAIHRSLGESAAAVDQGRLALGLVGPLVDSRPDRSIRDTTASAHSALADLLDPAEGKAHYLEAEAIWKSMGDDPTIRGHLAQLYYGVAGQKQGFGLAPSETFAAGAVEILEPLARDDHPRFDHDLARATHNLGLHLARIGRMDEALAKLRRALQIWESMPPERRTEDGELGIVACQNALGLYLKDRPGDPFRREALDMLRRAVQSCERLARKHPGRYLHRDALARAWSNLGSFHFAYQEYAQAEPCYREAARATEAILRDFPEVSAASIQLAHNLQDLATVEAGLGKRAEARAGFERALAIIEPRVASSPESFPVQECLATILLNQANLVRTADGPAAALPIQKRCVDAYEACHRAAPRNAYTITCIIGARGNLCGTLQALGKFAEALEQIDRVIALSEPAARRPARIQRALLLARSGRHERAVAEAGEMASEPGLDAESLYNLACVDALAVGAVRAAKDLEPARKNELAHAHTAAAIRLIERSESEGHFPRKDLLDLLAKDADLEAIRGDGELHKLIATLAR